MIPVPFAPSEKPGHSIWNGSFGVTGAQTNVALAGNIVSTQIEFKAPLPATGFVGDLHWVQKTNADLSRVSSVPGSSGPFNSTNSEWWLDNRYFFDHPEKTTITDGAVTYRVDYDIPSVTFARADTKWDIDQQFQMWLMWTPPGDDSIPVPIEEAAWNWSAHLTKTGAGWSFISRSPVATLPAVQTTRTGALVDSYPEWDHVFKNRTK